MGQSSQDNATVSPKATCTAGTKASMGTREELVPKDRPIAHKNYKNVSILVTLLVAMTMYQARHY